MATWFVNSHATGANSGTSWTDAFVSLGSAATAAAPGDLCLIDKTHAESIGVNTTWTFAGTPASRVILLVVDSTAGNTLATGATFTCTANVSLTLNGSIWAFGLNQLTWGTSGGNASNSTNIQTYESCSFAINPAAVGGNRALSWGFNNGGTGTQTLLRNCVLDCDTNGGSNSRPTFKGYVSLINCVVRANSAAGSIFTANFATNLYLDGCDLSASTATTLWNWGGSGGVCAITRCNLPAGYTATTGTPGAGASFTVERSAAGSIALPPLGLTFYQDLAGTIQSTPIRYRTGGATDEDQPNPIAWEMDAGPVALPFFVPLRSPALLSEWLTAGASKTFTVYFAGAAQLDASQVWIEISGPTNTSPAFTNGYNATSKASPQSTPALIPLDATSSWNGSGVGTPQKISLSYAPVIDGPVTARVCLGQTNGTIYLDPTLYVS